MPHPDAPPAPPAKEPAKAEETKAPAKPETKKAPNEDEMKKLKEVIQGMGGTNAPAPAK